MSKNKVKLNQDIFDADDDDENEWRGMPDFNQPDNGAYRQIIVSFDDKAGVEAFATAIGQHLTSKTKSIWYPPREKNNVVDLFYIDTSNEGKDGSA